MKKEIIQQLFARFEHARYSYQGIEFWSARELQSIFNYSDWRNFLRVIDKAKKTCEHTGENLADHFVAVKQISNSSQSSKTKAKDLALTRYACYLIAQNGDTTKPEIAFAQTYFAVQTRKQEIIEQRLLDVARVSARAKLSKAEKKLSGLMYERGVHEKDFGRIHAMGDKALFGGNSTQDMKNKLHIPAKRPLADFLPTLIIRAKDFATELTSHNVVEKNLKKELPISQEHVDNNLAVRNMLLERGVKPEDLPPAEDLKLVKRRVETDQRKVLKQLKKTSKKKN